MRREIWFRALALATSSAALFLLLELVLRALPVCDGTFALAVDASNPVARLTPDREFVFSRGWNFDLVTRKHTNNYGFLSDEHYTKEGPRPLLAAIGDSYVEAMQVTNAQAFPALLGRELGDRGRVYAFGLSGTALPSYLAYASFATGQFAPDALVFSIISNDFDESLLEYAYQPRNHYFVEGPDGRPVLQRLDYAPSLLKKLARRSALIRYLVVNCQLTPARVGERLRALAGDGAYVGNSSAAPDPKRLGDSRRAVDAFFALLPEATPLPPGRIAFLVDAIRPELYDAAAFERARGSYVARMREYFMRAARERGYEVLDLEPTFQAIHARDGSRFEFPTDRHWNARGHAVAARVICDSALFSRLYGPASCPQLQRSDF